MAWDGLKGRAGDWDKARFEAAAAPRAGVWLGAPPSRALDFRLTNSEVGAGSGDGWGVQSARRGRVRFVWGSWT
eukprot:4047457-Karenia_brevis.AAC.1